MTTISFQQAQQNRMIAQGADLNVSLGEGMQAAFDDAARTGATAAVGRAIKSVFDTSDEISAEDANQMFGLHGTESQFKPEEKLTVEAARARANDFHNLRMNEVIKETVNEDSPIMGNVTQFAASMSASMIDPVMLGANVVGAGLVGAGVKAITNSTRMFNGIARATPSAAKALLMAYSDDAVKSLSTVVAREGLENFTSGLIEESIIQNVGLGDERLAKKITWQDSFQNIVAGTLMGGALGTVLSKDGRKAVADRYLFDWGDDAAEFVKANQIIASMEVKAGHEKGRLEVDMMNKQKFGARPWYNVQESEFSPSTIPKKIFLSLDEEGAVHTFSNRGAGTVFTGSQTHAMNSGKQVVEVHTDKLKLANADVIVQNGKHTKIGTQLSGQLIEGVVFNTDMTKLARSIAILKDSEVDLSTVTPLTFKQATAVLKDMLTGKNLDEMVEVLGDVQARSESKFRPNDIIEKTLDQAGYNGYTFHGKDFDGKPAYQGVYVSPKYTQRIRREATIDVPEPSAGDKVKWQFEQEQMYRKHKDWVQTEAKSLRQVEDIKESLGLPKETPLDEVESKIKQNHVSEAVASTKERVSALTKAKDSLRAEFELKKKDGIEIDPDEERLATLMEEIIENKDPLKLIDEDRLKWDNYVGCILGLANKVVTK